MMDMVYNGQGEFRLKYRGQILPIKNGTKVDVDEETAKELSKREVNGEKQWLEASGKTPKKAKKGDE